MLEVLQFLFLPLVACFILVGIHSYLGLHVLSRGVIFVDISMAQIAALGTLAGMAAGFGHEGAVSYLFSFGFVLLAAAVFTFVRLEYRKVPQEAIIGIVYGLSLAGALLIAERVPEGAGLIKETLTGALLWVNWGTVITCGLVYAAIGVFHYLFRKNFFALSRKNSGHDPARPRLWDFLFYSTLGLVIVHAVKIGGVFVVFSLLVVPASMAMLFYESWKARIIVAWAVGLAVTTAATFLAYHYSLPNGPTIVCLLGLAMILAALVKCALNRNVFQYMKTGEPDENVITKITEGQ